MITIQQPLQWAIAQPVQLGQGSGVFTVPPASDELLVWLKGNSTDTQKLDSWKKPDSENFTMSQAHCITLNGVDEYGTFDTPFTVTTGVSLSVSFISRDITQWKAIFGQTVSLVSHLRTTISTGEIQLGQVGGAVSFNVFVSEDVPYKLEWNRSDGTDTVTLTNLSDLSVQTDSKAVVGDVTFEAVGRRGAGYYWDGQIFNINIDGINIPVSEGSGNTSFSSADGARSVVWTGTLANMWAERQDVYFYNSVGGWWEINADPVKYPYPVAGFDTHHPGNTFNNAETFFAPEEFPIGTANGIDDTITMLADRGTVISSGGTSTPSYIHPTITMTAGTIRDILFSDGTFMQLREGAGTDLYDSDGNLVATLNTSSEPSFWGGAQEVAQSIIDAESHISDIEKVSNGTFDSNLSDWIVSAGTAQVVAGEAEITSGTTEGVIEQNVQTEIGKTYLARAFVKKGTSSGTQFYAGSTYVGFSVSPTGEIVSDTFVATSTSTRIYGRVFDAGTGYIDNVSVKEVVENNYLTDGNGHALPMPQSSWEGLGEEVLDDPLFTNGLTSWSTVGTVTESNSIVTINGSTALAMLYQSKLIENIVYEATIYVQEISGVLQLINNNAIVYANLIKGLNTVRFTHSDSNANIILRCLTGNTANISSFSIREVNSVINYNKQYYFGCKGLTVFSRNTTDIEDAKMLIYQCKAEPVTVDGVPVTVDGAIVYVRI